MKNIECCTCGVIFAVSQALVSNWYQTGQTFWCPNGHGQSYRKSQVDVLKEKLSQKEKMIEELTDENIDLLAEIESLKEPHEPELKIIQ